MNDFEKVIAEVEKEVARQVRKWGEQDHPPIYWIVILTEEIGEAAKNALERERARYREELIHCAAVALNAIDSLDRGN